MDRKIEKKRFLPKITAGLFYSRVNRGRGGLRAHSGRQQFKTESGQKKRSNRYLWVFPGDYPIGWECPIPFDGIPRRYRRRQDQEEIRRGRGFREKRGKNHSIVEHQLGPEYNAFGGGLFQSDRQSAKGPLAMEQARIDLMVKPLGRRQNDSNENNDANRNF